MLKNELTHSQISPLASAQGVKTTLLIANDTGNLSPCNTTLHAH
jgi:hypothetical protein